ncbi:MAG: hypothetical protein A2Z02_00515 [Chloroflexi bacterium RBG_16_48_7]|nr:MAG: hypothetical protein A2Z02_00515 [Chloroflexi bacterium RBG_16_48_7]
MFDFIITAIHQAILRAGILNAVNIILLFITCKIIPTLKWPLAQDKWHLVWHKYYWCAWILIIVIAACFLVHEAD